jgi:hypothetical protein
VDKLSEYGLHPDEIKNKLSRMSDDQVHLPAQASDDVLAGGDGMGFVIGVLVIVLLVIVILKLLNKEIIIKYAGFEKSWAKFGRPFLIIYP